MVEMNSNGGNFFDDYSSFYKTGKIGIKPKMLNARFHALIESNKKIIENATILDLACHDGRWSFAALKNGAKKVYGIKRKKDLIRYLTTMRVTLVAKNQSISK